MFGKSKKEEVATKKNFKELVAELNETLSGEEVYKGFTESIDQYAALKELKARITAKQNEIKEVIKAEVPLAEMFGYSTSLRSKTQGRANF